MASKAGKWMEMPTIHDSSPVTPTHEALSGSQRPALIRTPPSTADLVNEPFPPLSGQLLTTPPLVESPSNISGSSNAAASPRREWRIPFPARKSEAPSVSSDSPDSHNSERPDTLPSLLKSSGAQTSPTPRGRTSSRKDSMSTGRRTYSDPAEPTRLTASSSRDVIAGSAKVSFDSEPALTTVNAPSGEKPEMLHRVTSSLERFRRALRPAPASDPVLPMHNSPPPAPPRQLSPQPPTTNGNSRGHSPHRPFESLLRNPYFWPPANRHEHFRPCDPYEHPSDQQPPRVFRRSHGILCGLCSIAGIPVSLPTGESLAYYISLLVRQLYRHFLLRLPSLYFARVWRIFFEVQVSKPEIDQMIHQHQVGRDFPIASQWISPVVPPGLSRFKLAWEEFVETLLKEWKTLNVVSALLLSAVLTIFQIDGTNHPVTRTAALASLVCGLMSLVYGCVYVVRFTAMKNMRKAARWAEEAQRTTSTILWNVWVFLALPAIWLAYSVIFFCVSILSYVWTAGVEPSPSPIPNKLAVYPRSVISGIFIVGLIYFYMVVTTFRSYADPWPEDSNSAPESSNGYGANEGDLERGRSLTEEERERRISLRRFGSPDILARTMSREKGSTPTPLRTTPAPGVASGTAGGFAPRIGA